MAEQKVGTIFTDKTTRQNPVPDKVPTLMSPEGAALAKKSAPQSAKK